MEFSRERITSQFFDEIAPLIHAHYKEVAHYQDIPLAPNFQHYVDADAAGILRLYTAREDGDKKLVGYAIFTMAYNPHYSGSLQAMQDILYLDPYYRGLQFGESFIRFCDEKLKEESVQVVYHHVKTKHNFGKLLEKIGYQQIDVIFGRRLDG